jgi:pimeloyl-ACP methyl ester carboxylesterase
MASTKEQFDESLIKKISCPTLIVWGKEDKIVNPKYAERFHQDIKGSQVIIFDSCVHVPMMERPLDVQRDVLRFLNNAAN